MKRSHVYVLFAAIGVVLTGFMQGVPLHAQSNAPVSAARFGISIDGVQIGVFEQLISEADLGTGAGGQAITLTGGRTRGLEMAAWHELVVLGDVAAARKSASLTMYSSDGKPVARYHLTDAWPTKIEIGTLKAGASEVLMETVTMTCEFIQRVAV